MQLFRAGGRDTWPRMPSHLYVASLGITAAGKNNATVTLTSLRCLRWTKYPDQKLDDYSSGPLCPSLQSDETITLVIVLSMHISTSTYSRVVYEQYAYSVEQYVLRFSMHTTYQLVRALTLLTYYFVYIICTLNFHLTLYDNPQYQPDLVRNNKRSEAQSPVPYLLLAWFCIIEMRRRMGQIDKHPSTQ